MANKTRTYRASIDICDTHRGYFGQMRLGFHLAYDEGQQHALLRLLASCLYAHDDLQLSAGAIKSKRPNLYLKNAKGDMTLWVCLGAPSMGLLTRACREASQVVVLGIADPTWKKWWTSVETKVLHLSNLGVVMVDEDVLQSLLPCLDNRMRWHCVLDHETLWLHQDSGVFEVRPKVLKQTTLRHAQAA